jgi:hypothetical protein
MLRCRCRRRYSRHTRQSFFFIHQQEAQWQKKRTENKRVGRRKKKKEKKLQEEKEKTKKERKTATIDWSCCRLASLGRLTLLLRLFGSEREKMRTPIDVFYCSCLHILLCVYMRRRASVPTDEVSATESSNKQRN